jgi:collagenase-like PrtC family protease
MKRGGVGVCFGICQQPWDLFAGGRRVDGRPLPSRQISRLADVRAYADAGADVLKLQGRSLPAEHVASLVRRYRDAIDGPVAEAPPAALPASWATVGR